MNAARIATNRREERLRFHTGLRAGAGCLAGSARSGFDHLQRGRQDHEQQCHVRLAVVARYDAAIRHCRPDHRRGGHRQRAQIRSLQRLLTTATRVVKSCWTLPGDVYTDLRAVHPADRLRPVLPARGLSSYPAAILLVAAAAAACIPALGC